MRASLQPSRGAQADACTFQTSLGPVPLWGEFDRFDAARPMVFVIRGAFDELDSMTRFQDHAPDVDVALVHLPGMHSPYFADCSVHAFAQAFDEVLAALRRPRVILLGLSTGALVAMAMQGADALIAVEPPLSPPAMWPLIPRLRTAAAQDPEVARWVEGLFSMADYGDLLADCLPGVVLLGGEALEPIRPVDRLPSLVSAADRERIATTPHLRVMTVPGVGHNIPAQAPGALLCALRQVSS